MSAAPIMASSDDTAPPLDLDTLYEQHVDFVWRTLWHFGVSEHQLEDALQDVFLVVHRRLDSFEGRSKPTTWLYGIAFRVAKDYRRQKRRKGDPLDAFEEASHVHPSSDPSEAATRRQARDTLARILDELDDKKREVFVMVELDEMSVQEAAVTLGENRNTVASRLRAAWEIFDRAVARIHRRES